MSDEATGRGDARSDASADAKEVTGEFSFSRERGLSFACHSLEHDFDLTKLALLALKAEVERQLTNEAKCPFAPVVRLEAEDGSGAVQIGGEPTPATVKSYKVG